MVKESVEGGVEMNGRNAWRRVRAAVVAIGMAALMSGCGLFGCGGAGSNGGFLAGCAVGTRF